MLQDPIVRFRKKWRQSSEHSYKGEPCREWQGSTDGKGYGKFCFKGRMIRAHRYSYEYVKGAIPQGLELDHLCRNRACILPSHLEAVTHKENVRRGQAGQEAAQKVFCISGHLFDEINTYWRSDGRRQCKECKRRNQIRYRANLTKKDRK